MDTKTELDEKKAAREKHNASALADLAKEFETDPTQYTDHVPARQAVTIRSHWKDHPTALPDGQHHHKPSGQIFHIEHGRLVRVTEAAPAADEAETRKGAEKAKAKA